MRTKSNQLLWAVVEAARRAADAFDYQEMERCLQMVQIQFMALDAAPWVAVDDVATGLIGASDWDIPLPTLDDCRRSGCANGYIDDARAAMRAMGCGEGEK